MTDQPAPPRRISAVVHSVNLTGYLIPIGRDGCPLLLAMPGTSDMFLATFSSQETLDAIQDTGAFPKVMRVRVIEDHHTFIESMCENDTLPFKLRLAVDPRRSPACGHIHFLEIPLDGIMPSPT